MRMHNGCMNMDVQYSTYRTVPGCLFQCCAVLYCDVVFDPAAIKERQGPPCKATVQYGIATVNSIPTGGNGGETGGA